MMAKIRAEQEVTPDGRKLVFKVSEDAAGRKFEGTPVLARIKTERVSAEVTNEVLARTGVKVGDPISEDTAHRIREIASSVDEHVRVSFDSDGRGRIVMVLLTR